MERFTSVGSVPQFNSPTKQDWDKFKSKLEFYFEANEITDDKRKRAILFSSTGDLVFDVVHDAKKEKKITELSLKEAYEILEARFKTGENKYIRGNIFSSRKQNQREGIQEYVAELRKLAQGCGFSNEDDAVLTQVISGLADEGMKKSLLLAGSSLDLAKAIEKITASEEADQFLQQMRQQSGSHSQDVYKLEENEQGEEGTGNVFKASAYKQHFRPATKQTLQTPELLAARSSQTAYKDNRNCPNCGFKHETGACPAYGKQCNFCKKPNHFLSVCRARLRSTSEANKSKKPAHKPVAATYRLTSESEEEVARKSHFTSYLYKVHTTAVGVPPPVMIAVLVENVKLQMEVDTGSGYSIIGMNTYRKNFSRIPLQKINLILNSWSKEAMPVAGEIKVRVKLHHQNVVLPLVVMEIDGPSLLGRGWFNNLGMQVGGLHYSTSSNRVQGKLPQELSEFAEIFSPGIGRYTGPPVHIQVKEGAVFKFCKARTVPLAFQEAADQYLDKHIEQGVYTPVRYAALGIATPGLAVPKANGTIRYVGDYSQTVNKICEKEVYPLPTVQEILSQLAGCKYYIKLDMANAFLQVTVDKETAQLLTMNTHRGLVEVNRLCPGLSAAPNIFQRLLESLLTGSGKVLAYLDDILIGAQSLEELWTTAGKVLTRLKEAGFKLSIDKCLFAVTELDFVGYHITGNGVEPTSEKVEAVMKAPSPTKLEELEVYLGAINYYDRFFPNKAENFAPLYELLHGDAPWRWSAKQEECINYAKSVLSSGKVLMHFTPDLPIILATDAGPNGVGVVLSHVLPDGTERPVAYASRTLRGSERNYSQLDKEGLAVVFGVVKFNYWLLGRKFTITTDNLPLTGIFRGDKGIPDNLSPRMLRWCLLLSNYQYTIHHRLGKHHANADFLSRMPIQSNKQDFVFPEPRAGILYLQQAPEGAPIKARCVAEETGRDPILAKLRDILLNGGSAAGLPDEIAQVIKRTPGQFTVMSGCVLKGDRVVIPSAMRQQVLSQLHKNHQGMVRTKQVARSYVWWPGMDKEIESKVSSCGVCQVSRKLPPKVPTMEWPKTKQPWTRVHVDYAGPFHGKTFLILVDSHSKWVEVAETGGSLTAATTIKFLKIWFAAQGLPAELVSDNAACFLSQEFQTFLADNLIRHTTSAPVYPATNGQAERTVQTVKSMLQKVPANEWGEKLPEILLTLRTTPTSEGRSPAEILNGRKLTTLFDKLHPRYDQERSSRPDVTPEVLPPSRTFKLGDGVLYRNYGQGGKWKEGRVAVVLGRRYFLIQSHDGRYKVRRHINQILKVKSESLVLPLQEGARVEVDVLGEDQGEAREAQSEQVLGEEPATVEQPMGPQRPTSFRQRRMPVRLNDYLLN